MSREVAVVGSAMTLREAARAISASGVNGAPVVAGGRVVGVVSAGDLLRFTERPSATGPRSKVEAHPAFGPVTSPSEFYFRYWTESEEDLYDRLVGRGHETESGARRSLDVSRVLDVMSRDLHALPPHTPLSEAADYMLRHEIHRLLVVDGERLLGVVTTADMVRAMGGGGSRRRF